jgi:hypothetical protein
MLLFNFHIDISISQLLSQHRQFFKFRCASPLVAPPDNSPDRFECRCVPGEHVRSMFRYQARDKSGPMDVDSPEDPLHRLAQFAVPSQEEGPARKRASFSPSSHAAPR